MRSVPGMRRMKITGFALLMLGLAALGGCAPRVANVTALHTGSDLPTFWAYIQTDDLDKSGIYRCHDVDGKPVCKRAKMLAPCTRDHCGE